MFAGGWLVGERPPSRGRWANAPGRLANTPGRLANTSGRLANTPGGSNPRGSDSQEDSESESSAGFRAPKPKGVADASGVLDSQEESESESLAGNTAPNSKGVTDGSDSSDSLGESQCGRSSNAIPKKI